MSRASHRHPQFRESLPSSYRRQRTQSPLRGTLLRPRSHCGEPSFYRLPASECPTSNGRRPLLHRSYRRFAGLPQAWSPQTRGDSPVSSESAGRPCPSRRVRRPSVSSPVREIPYSFFKPPCAPRAPNRFRMAHNYTPSFPTWQVCFRAVRTFVFIARTVAPFCPSLTQKRTVPNGLCVSFFLQQALHKSANLCHICGRLKALYHVSVSVYDKLRKVPLDIRLLGVVPILLL